MSIQQVIKDYGDSNILLMYNSFKRNHPDWEDGVILYKMLKLYLHDIKFNAEFKELMGISLKRAQFCTDLLEQYLE